MSLYLTIFDGDHEVLGWVFGHYSDFGLFRDIVATTVDSVEYPILLRHSDSDGEWGVEDLAALRTELTSIAAEFAQRPPAEVVGGFEHTAEYRANAQSLFECFHNVGGLNLFKALLDLCEEGLRLRLPILFQ